MTNVLRGCISKTLNVQELSQLYDLGGGVECLMEVLDGRMQPVSVHGNKIIYTL